MKNDRVLDVKEIPKNPLLFGFAISKLYKKWALSALAAVFVATFLSRFSVVVLSQLTDAIAAKPLAIQAVWLYASSYVFLFFCLGKCLENQWICRHALVYELSIFCVSIVI